MSIEIIQQRLKDYQAKTTLEEENALKEISQEVILMALANANFFRYGAFCGGTALRIIYKLPRFSEDLDFSLLTPNQNFKWKPFLENIHEQLINFGYQIEVIDRANTDKTVQHAFLKDNSIGKLLNLNYRLQNGPAKKINIKLEIDTHPPEGAQTDATILDFPLPYTIRTLNLPSLFAGKCHALLCREYTKGRDWYDFIWYTSKKTQINFELLSNSLNQAGPWKNQNINIDLTWLKQQLALKINKIDWPTASHDVARFLKSYEQKSLELWSAEFFLSRLDKM